MKFVLDWESFDKHLNEARDPRDEETRYSGAYFGTSPQKPNRSSEPVRYSQQQKFQSQNVSGETTARNMKGIKKKIANAIMEDGLIGDMNRLNVDEIKNRLFDTLDRGRDIPEPIKREMKQEAIKMVSALSMIRWLTNFVAYHGDSASGTPYQSASLNKKPYVPKKPTMVDYDVRGLTPAEEMELDRIRRGQKY